MKIASTLVPEAVVIGMTATARDLTVRQLVSALGERRAVDIEMACKKLSEAERLGPVLIPVGRYCVALPHVATNACKQVVMVAGTSQIGVPWGPSTGKANLIVLVMCPPEAQGLHLRLLARIARMCESEDFISSLINAESPAEFVARIADAESSFGEIPPAKGLPTFCVLGAGNGGMAMAGHLAITGCKVNLFNRSEERIKPIQERGGLDVSGEIEGFAPLNLVTTDPAQALENVDVAMIVTPATAHRTIAEAIAEHLKDGQVVVLNPGRTGGALEVARVLRERNPSLRPYLAEAQTLLYASRITNPGQVHIFSIKNSVPLATLPAYHVVDVLPLIRKALPQFVPGDNILKTSLDNIGAVFHPAITVLNAGRIEETHGDFEYYVQGVTPSVASVLEAVDRERVNVASALGIRANTAREWLYLAYDAVGKTLIDAMRANPGYSGIKAPGTLQHRYISEDVPTSLVPIASIGEMLGVPTPITRSIISLASTMHGVDYWREGRTVDRLGIAGMSVKDIRFLVVGAEQPASPSSGSTPVASDDDGQNVSTSVFDQPPESV